MTSALKRAIAEAEELPKRKQDAIAERWLIDLLEESPETAISDEWRREIRRRIKEIRDGTVQPIPSEEVHRKVRELLRKRRT